jgi:hypothetical protein
MMVVIVARAVHLVMDVKHRLSRIGENTVKQLVNRQRNHFTMAL